MPAEADETQMQTGMRPPSPQDDKDDRELPSTNKQQMSITPPYLPAGPAAKCITLKRKHHAVSAGNITLTAELLRFLKKAPDKGVGTINKIAQRQITRAADCAEIMSAIFHDIFLHPPADNYITPLLQQGRQNNSGGPPHKHSMGVTPRFAFGTLLLKAVAPKQSEAPPGLPYYIISRSNNILHRLRQVVTEYDTATTTIALSFNFGRSYQRLTPAFLAELKHIHRIPWPIIIDEPAQTPQQRHIALHHHHR